MFSAFDKAGDRVNAIDCTAGEVYRCPICEQEVQLKKGRVRIPHFAHINSECTDTWTYEMTEWHRRMQSYFPPDVREVVVQKNGIRHRADILSDDIVIEFQHSPISLDEFNDRNDFYESHGYRVTWVFNLDDQYKKKQLYFSDSENEFLMKWNYAYKIFSDSPRPRDTNAKFAIWLTWEDDDTDVLWKIIWSSQNHEGSPDFKNIIVSAHSLEMSNETNPVEFFHSAKDHLRSRLHGFNGYKVLTSGKRGLSKDNYYCPIKKDLLRMYGREGCERCQYCIAIEKTSITNKEYRIYCHHPHSIIGREGYYQVPKF